MPLAYTQSAESLAPNYQANIHSLWQSCSFMFTSVDVYTNLHTYTHALTLTYKTTLTMYIKYTENDFVEGNRGGGFACCGEFLIFIIFVSLPRRLLSTDVARSRAIACHSSVHLSIYPSIRPSATLSSEPPIHSSVFFLLFYYLIKSAIIFITNSFCLSLWFPSNPPCMQFFL